MKFSRHIKQKIILLLITLIFSMFIPLISEPLKAYAVDGSMTDEDSGGASGIVDGGPTYARTGYLFYLIDTNNSQISTTEAVVSQAIAKKDGTAITNGNILLESRYGVKAASANIGFPWQPPFTSDGNGHGSDVKQYMLDDYGGKPYAYSLIELNWGGTLADQWYNKEAYLVFEPIYWHCIHKNNRSTGIWYCTTAYYWGAIQSKLGLPETGEPLIRKYTNGVYNYCVMLEDCQEVRDLGYTAPDSGTWLRTNAQMNTKNLGNGIGIIWNEDTDSLIHTYWQPNGSPGKPELSNPPKNGMMNIVKSYYTEKNNGLSYTDDGTFYTLNCTSNISIDQEPEYKIVSWKITNKLDTNIKSTNGKEITWNPSGTISGSGTNPKVVSLKTPQRCVYVLLKRVETEEEEIDSNYIISESTITRQVHFSKPDSSEDMTKIQDIEFNWISPAHKNSCDGHDYADSTAYCSWGTWEDDTLQFSLKNSKKEDFPDILSTKAEWENVVTLNGLDKRFEDKTRTEVGEASFPINEWDYACVLLRGKDKLTVADWKNKALGTEEANSDLAEVSESGFTIANTDSGERKTEDYYEQFKGYFEDDSTDKDTTRAITSGSGHGDCDNDTQTASLENDLEVNVKVKLETYSGSEDGGINDTTCDSSVRKNLKLLGFNKSTGKEVPSGGTVSFRPYIQMNYDTFTEYEKKAYVLGEHQRSLSPNDYAEISWNKQGIPNLKLDSLQWSTHASAVNFITETFGYDALSEFKVLPGGATLSLTIDKKAYQNIQLTTYQCIVTGSGKEQIETAGGSDGDLTEEKAIAAHEAYVLDVIDTMDKVNVEQWVSMNIEDESAWKSGSAVGPDINLKDAGHSNQKGSTEDKYYFRGEDEQTDKTKGIYGAGEGDLDVYPNPTKYADEKLDTKVDYYTFFVNTYGEIRYTVNDIYPNTDGDERKGKLANDTTAKIINNRTHIVDKLKAAVELNTGDDSSGRSNTGKAWYNEAFDGITVIVQKTDIKVGYREPVQRTSVLDVKLTQTQTSQKDLFNINKYNLSQYRTKNYSDKYNKDNEIGMFKGYDIYMDEMNMLFWSQHFYIPNATVDDLR